MKFTTAWSKTAANNVTLKVATVTLAFIVCVQLIIITINTFKSPLIIERSCYSKQAQLKNAQTTKDEISAFLSEALPMRFDTNGNLKQGYIALDESVLREKELAILKSKQMSQKILVNDVKFQENDIYVLSDRIISIGKIKSVLPLNLKVTVQQITRNESNIYGLILSSVVQIEDKEDKSK